VQTSAPADLQKKALIAIACGYGYGYGYDCGL